MQVNACNTKLSNKMIKWKCQKILEGEWSTEKSYIFSHTFVLLKAIKYLFKMILIDLE